MAGKRGRPEPKPPTPEHITIAEAASILEVSYSTVYRRVLDWEIPNVRDDAGVRYVLRKELANIALQNADPEYADGRRAIQVRPDLERYAAWEREARPNSVGPWLGELADAAVERGRAKRRKARSAARG